jgi:hypothetical protein
MSIALDNPKARHQRPRINTHNAHAFLSCVTPLLHGRIAAGMSL